jgi:hypothetical protein
LRNDAVRAATNAAIGGARAAGTGEGGVARRRLRRNSRLARRQRAGGLAGIRRGLRAAPSVTRCIDLA